VWAKHHVIFDHIRAADRTVLLLNTVLLMVVAFLPFATSVLADALRDDHDQRKAVAFYGIAFGVRSPSGRLAAGARRRGDRCVQRLLLAPDSRRGLSRRSRADVGVICRA
jgi:hypothetical protein